MEENKDMNAIIGKNLLKHRKNMKLTQMEVAEKFNYSDKSISKWEKGEAMPSIEVLCELANFYGVSLDDLTNENHEIENTENTKPKKEKKVKEKKEKIPRQFSTHLIVTLLSAGAVWLVATILFVVFKLCFNANYYMCFVWAIPATCVVLIVFNAIWGRMRFLFPILTVLLWTILLGLQLQILPFFNIWPIYFLGIPLQIAIILWGALIKKPKGYYKKNQIKEETESVQKEDV